MLQIEYHEIRWMYTFNIHLNGFVTIRYTVQVRNWNCTIENGVQNQSRYNVIRHKAFGVCTLSTYDTNIFEMYDIRAKTS